MQSSYVIDNAPGATVRTNLNAVLQAIVSLNAGSTAPSPTYPNMIWFDTSTNILKKRDNANSIWVELISNIDGSKLVGLANIPSGSGVIPTANLPTIPDPKTYVNAMGNVTGTISPQVDKINTAVLTGDVTLTMPTPTTGELHNVVFEFTMASAHTVTVSGVTWNWGAAPALDATGKKNRIVFDTIDGGTTWKGYFSQF